MVPLFLIAVLPLCALNSNDATPSNKIKKKTTEPKTTSSKVYQQDVPAPISRKYRRDAARIILRIEAEKEELRYQNIKLPNDKVESMYKLLCNIYTRQQVVRNIAECNVHTFPNPSIDHIVVIFDKNVSWAKPLQAGLKETNSPKINELLFKYGLVIEKHVNWNSTQDAVTIRSKEPLNMAALANEFYNITGVKEIDLGVPKVEGNDIKVKRLSNAWEIEYILRFGSLSGSGAKKHSWKFKAGDGGDIYFISEQGDPIPTWMKCAVDGERLAFRG
ncbi:MAG: hypothetical protein KA010_01560 [Saprospiraceae bacterium]|nr:hypothetical protein [Saprospiraceae bacterium]